MNIRSMTTNLILGLLALGGSAWSHDVTIWPAQNEKAVKLLMNFGDPGDYQPIDRIRFVELAVLDSKGVKISFLHDIESGPDNKTLVAPKLRLGDWPGGTYLAEARYDNGFYIHDTENRAVATTKEWFPEAIDSAHYMKFSKTLFRIGASGEGYDRVLGHRLELIPLADPFAAKEGTSIPIEVRFDGAIQKDHIVEIGDDAAVSRGPEIRTNDHGVVLVKLDHKGFYRLAVDHRAPSKYPNLFLYDDYSASLVFAR